MLRRERRLGRNGLRGTVVATENPRAGTTPAASVAAASAPASGTASAARETMAEASGKNPDDFQWEGLAAQGRPAAVAAGRAADPHEDI
ncbi:MAG: hypothetical protein H5U02_08105 [Clostridia bacterium]|nr:hypothetical protein [Clostridia bacterium]